MTRPEVQNQYRLAQPSLEAGGTEYAAILLQTVQALPPLDAVALALYSCERDAPPVPSALTMGVRLMTISAPELESLRATARALLPDLEG